MLEIPQKYDSLEDREPIAPVAPAQIPVIAADSSLRDSAERLSFAVTMLEESPLSPKPTSSCAAPGWVTCCIPDSLRCDKEKWQRLLKKLLTAPLDKHIVREFDSYFDHENIKQEDLTPPYKSFDEGTRNAWLNLTQSCQAYEEKIVQLYLISKEPLNSHTSFAALEQTGQLVEKITRVKEQMYRIQVILYEKLYNVYEAKGFDFLGNKVRLYLYTHLWVKLVDLETKTVVINLPKIRQVVAEALKQKEQENFHQKLDASCNNWRTLPSLSTDYAHLGGKVPSKTSYDDLLQQVEAKITQGEPLMIRFRSCKVDFDKHKAEFMGRNVEACYQQAAKAQEELDHCLNELRIVNPLPLYEAMIKDFGDRWIAWSQSKVLRSLGGFIADADRLVKLELIYSIELDFFQYYQEIVKEIENDFDNLERRHVELKINAQNQQDQVLREKEAKRILLVGEIQAVGMKSIALLPSALQEKLKPYLEQLYLFLKNLSLNEQSTQSKLELVAHIAKELDQKIERQKISETMINSLATGLGNSLDLDRDLQIITNCS